MEKNPIIVSVQREGELLGRGAACYYYFFCLSFISFPNSGMREKPKGGGKVETQGGYGLSLLLKYVLVIS